MKSIIFSLLFSLTICSCTQKESPLYHQSDIKNKQAKSYPFLDCMYSDSYFPKPLVDKCKYILVELCIDIEILKTKDLNRFYKLTQRATTSLNNLQDEFFKHGSEIETVARECLAESFDKIALFYGYEADGEEMIVNREW